MTYDFTKLSKDILRINSQSDFETYLKSNFMEIEEYLLNISDEQIDEIKFDIEDLLYDLLDNNLIKTNNSQMINAFLILVSEKLLQKSFIGAITIILDYINDSSTKLRLEAAKLYLKVNDLSKDYVLRLDNILQHLEESSKIDEYNKKAIYSLFYFYESALKQFQRVENESLSKLLTKLLISKIESYSFLKDKNLKDFFKYIENHNIKDNLKFLKEYTYIFKDKKVICKIRNEDIIRETGTYSEKLYTLENPNFDKIRDISFKHVQSIGDPIELYNGLQRGEAIIDDRNLLYKYLSSLGGKHKAKLDSSYDEIIDKLISEKIDIIDWGCGQGTATMLLLNYANERNIKLDLENITLIDPSQLALSRALLHIDVLKQQDYKIKVINSDLDCLKIEDLKNDSTNKTLHIFSNILDIETVSIEKKLFDKISNSLTKDNIFICISPNRNDKTNSKTDIFYSYFDESYDTKLISTRSNNIANVTRYEKIFQVKTLDKEENNCLNTNVIKENNSLDVIHELNKYSDYISPFIDIKILETSINTDPEYVIFKLRKIAEIITSKVYSLYEDNYQSISFNDKIRYLEYEQKIFDKTITNYLHTIRTIGNSGVHESNRSIYKLKLDVHLMIVALINFLNEIKDKKIS